MTGIAATLLRRSLGVVILTVFSASGRESIAGLIAPSESGYVQVYGLNIGTDTNLQTTTPSYYLDNSAAHPVGSFKRVAYHLELQSGAGPLEYVWVSMDAFTNDASLLGVPSVAGSNAVFQQTVSNMNVFSNKAGVVTGTGIATGNIEFWSTNYGPGNTLPVPGASGTTFDFGDGRGTTGLYGSMQIHNYGASQTVIAFNNFQGVNGGYDLGIGNRPTSNPDWTFARNAGSYTVKTLDVYVLVPEPSTTVLLGLALLSCIFRRKRRIL